MDVTFWRCVRLNPNAIKLRQQGVVSNPSLENERAVATSLELVRRVRQDAGIEAVIASDEVADGRLREAAAIEAGSAL
jgi:hypothetical protein